jgi:GMP synthase-like glutamine amidotransferase
MHIHWIQHVSFEGLGCIEPWLAENGHEVTCTRLWAGEAPPQVSNQLAGQASLYSESLCLSCNQDHTRSRIREAGPTIKTQQFGHDIDGLIVMGGPMGVYDEAVYPWLADEKIFIKQIIDQNKPVLGICLGAQLIADVLGAEVRSAGNKEIGFFPIIGNPEHEFSKPWKTGTVFHWHGDTFGIPDGAVHLASSAATKNQAFLFKDNVLALQFHLETTEESLMSLYENAKDEIVEAPFIQTLEATALRLAKGDPLADANMLMRGLLGRLFCEQSEECQLTNTE